MTFIWKVPTTWQKVGTWGAIARATHNLLSYTYTSFSPLQTLDFSMWLEYIRLIPTSRLLLLLSSLPGMLSQQIVTGLSPSSCSVLCSEVYSLQRASLTIPSQDISTHPLPGLIFLQTIITWSYKINIYLLILYLFSSLESNFHEYRFIACLLPSYIPRD